MEKREVDQPRARDLHAGDLPVLLAEGEFVATYRTAMRLDEKSHAFLNTF